MKRRAIAGMPIGVVLVAATALALLFTTRIPLAVLTSSELALKLPSPPDDSCFQIQRTLTDLPEEAVRESSPLGADERAVYEAVLERWNSKSHKPLNLSNRTTQLDHNIFDCECLKGIDIQSLGKATRSFHLLTRDVLPARKIKLVDAELQSAVVQTNDPRNSMSKGVSVNAAVDKAFANGLFELSEIAFDREHRRAIVSYSFVCGSLCESSGVWLFEKVDGVWKRSEHTCGGWVS